MPHHSSPWSSNRKQLTTGLGPVAVPGPYPQWVINGRQLTLLQFVDEIWPDPKDQQRSFFLLKHQPLTTTGPV